MVKKTVKVGKTANALTPIKSSSFSTATKSNTATKVAAQKPKSGAAGAVAKAIKALGKINAAKANTVSTTRGTKTAKIQKPSAGSVVSAGVTSSAKKTALLGASKTVSKSVLVKAPAKKILKSSAAATSKSNPTPDGIDESSILLETTRTAWPIKINGITIDATSVEKKGEAKTVQEALIQLLQITQNLHKDIKSWNANQTKITNLTKKWADPLSKLQINMRWEGGSAPKQSIKMAKGVTKAVAILSPTAAWPFNVSTVSQKKPKEKQVSSSVAIGALDAVLQLQKTILANESYSDTHQLKLKKWHKSNALMLIDALCQQPAFKNIKEHPNASAMGENIVSIMREGIMLPPSTIKAFHQDAQTTVKCFGSGRDPLKTGLVSHPKGISEQDIQAIEQMPLTIIRMHLNLFLDTENEHESLQYRGNSKKRYQHLAETLAHFEGYLKDNQEVLQINQAEQNKKLQWEESAAFLTDNLVSFEDTPIFYSQWDEDTADLKGLKNLKNTCSERIVDLFKTCLELGFTRPKEQTYFKDVHGDHNGTGTPFMRSEKGETLYHRPTLVGTIVGHLNYGIRLDDGITRAMASMLELAISEGHTIHIKNDNGEEPLKVISNFGRNLEYLDEETAPFAEKLAIQMAGSLIRAVATKKSLMVSAEEELASLSSVALKDAISSMLEAQEIDQHIKDAAAKDRIEKALAFYDLHHPDKKAHRETIASQPKKRTTNRL